MKYTVQCSCGHERTVQIYGKSCTHEKQLQYYKDNECLECHYKSLLEQAKEKGLPELKGSEKQINWALQLREKHLDIIKKNYEDSKNPQYLQLHEFVASQDEAKTFINAETTGTLSVTKYYIGLYRNCMMQHKEIA